MLEVKSSTTSPVKHFVSSTRKASISLLTSRAAHIASAASTTGYTTSSSFCNKPKTQFIEWHFKTHEGSKCPVRAEPGKPVCQEPVAQIQISSRTRNSLWLCPCRNLLYLSMPQLKLALCSTQVLTEKLISSFIASNVSSQVGSKTICANLFQSFIKVFL
jgi:hypothetical protein